MKIEIKFTTDGDLTEVALMQKIMAMAAAEAPEGTEVEIETTQPAEEPAQAEASEPTGAPTQPEAPASITDAELRQHMDMAIAKFAGNDYSTSKDPRVQTIRKECTANFRKIAQWLGAEKPTQLKEESRQKFIDELNNLFLSEDKNGGAPVVEWMPF